MGCLDDRPRRAWRRRDPRSPCWSTFQPWRIRGRPGKWFTPYRRSCCWCWPRRWPVRTTLSRRGCGARRSYRSCAASWPSGTASPRTTRWNDVINALDPELFKTCFVTPPTPPASVPVGMEPQARLGRATARARARHRGDRWQDLAPQPRAGQGARAVASGLGPPAPLAPAAPQSDRPKADGRAANGWSSARRPWPGNPTRLRRSRCFWSAWRSPAPW